MTTSKSDLEAKEGQIPNESNFLEFVSLLGSLSSRAGGSSPPEEQGAACKEEPQAAKEADSQAAGCCLCCLALTCTFLPPFTHISASDLLAENLEATPRAAETTSEPKSEPRAERPKPPSSLLAEAPQARPPKPIPIVSPDRSLLPHQSTQTHIVSTCTHPCIQGSALIVLPGCSPQTDREKDPDYDSLPSQTSQSESSMLQVICRPEATNKEEAYTFHTVHRKTSSCRRQPGDAPRCLPFHSPLLVSPGERPRKLYAERALNLPLGAELITGNLW